MCTVKPHREMKLQGQAALSGFYRGNGTGDRRRTSVAGLLVVHKEAGPESLRHIARVSIA